MQPPDFSTTQTAQFYHRASFVWFLRQVKHVVSVNQWDSMMRTLLGMIENDPRCLMYCQELYAYLYVHGLSTAQAHIPLIKGLSKDVSKQLVGWQSVPSVVCLTLKIPRASINPLTDIPVEVIGTPLLRCAIVMLFQGHSEEAPQWFNVLNLSFGKLRTSEAKDGADLELQVEDDELGWNGNSSLLVSFYVPSWLPLDPRVTRVGFGFGSMSPENFHVLQSKFGGGSKIFEAAPDDKDHVFITRHLPNLCGRTTTSNIEPKNEPEKPYNVEVATKLTHGQITAFIGRINFNSQELKSQLAGMLLSRYPNSLLLLLRSQLGESARSIAFAFPPP